MTHKERLLALLESFGVTPNTEGTESAVTLYSGEGGVDGYAFFHCTFVFDEDGSFKSVGVWE